MGRDDEAEMPVSEQEDSALASGYSRLFSRTFHAFRYRDFRLMWCGAFTSTIGTWMQTVSQAWLVFTLTGSPFYLGLIAFLGEAPIMLFSILGGAAADRIDRRKLLLGSQYVQMSSAFILTALVYFDSIQIWHFMVLVSLVGTAQAFGAPAYQALISGLVKRKDMPNAIALNSIQFNLARVLGPVLAGVVMDSLGAAACFALNGISFLAVILSLLLIRSSFSPAPSDDSVWHQIKRGFSFVKGQGALVAAECPGICQHLFRPSVTDFTARFRPGRLRSGIRWICQHDGILGSGCCRRGTPVRQPGLDEEPGAVRLKGPVAPISPSGAVRILPESLLCLGPPLPCRNLHDVALRIHHLPGPTGNDRRDARKSNEHLHGQFPRRNSSRQPLGWRAGLSGVTLLRYPCRGHSAGRSSVQLPRLKRKGQQALAQTPADQSFYVMMRPETIGFPRVLLV